MGKSIQYNVLIQIFISTGIIHGNSRFLEYMKICILLTRIQAIKFVEQRLTDYEDGR